MSRSLDGAVVALIGATGGMGLALRAELEERGATVIGFGRSTGPPRTALLFVHHPIGYE